MPSARDAAFEELTLEERWPSVYAELLDIRRVLEKRFGCVCDFEFTVEDGRLYILGVRKAKRTRVANLRFALQFFEEGVIGLSEALARIDASDILEFVRPAIAHSLGGTDAFPYYVTGAGPDDEALQLYIYAEAPEEFSVQSKALGREEGYVLYHVTMTKPEGADDGAS